MGLFLNKIRNIDEGVNKTGTIFAYIGAAMLFIMMIIGAMDVIGRYLFNSSISGTIEINKNLMAGVVAFSWAYTQANRAHARVDFIVERFSFRSRAIAYIIGDILSLLFFGLITWQSCEAGILTWREQRYFQIINFPIAILYFMISLGAFVACLLMIFQLKSTIQHWGKANMKEVGEPG